MDLPRLSILSTIALPRRRDRELPRLRATLAMGALGLLAACAGEPTVQTGPDAETVMDGKLARVDNTRSALVYIDADADYARYRKVRIVPLNLDNVEIVQGSRSASMVNRYNREWELTDSDRERLRDEFRKSMEKTIGDDDHFEITDQDGDDVLRLEAMVTRIAPTAPKDDAASRGAGRSYVITDGAGSISVAMLLADGDSGEVLAVIKDTYSSQNNVNWGINNSVTNLAELRRAFNSWGTRLRNGLLALRERASAGGPEAS
jgi:hypothetical protein